MLRRETEWRRARGIARASLVLLLLIAGIASHRAAGLLFRWPELRAHGERQFFHWAYRDARLGPALLSVEPSLRSGEAVRILCPRSGYDPDWLRVMALYYLPRQVVLGAAREGVVATRLSRATRIELSRHGGARVVRQALDASP